MNTARACLSLVVVLGLTAVASGAQQQRVALVIGNSAYRNVPKLKNPRNDAEDLSQRLRALGFQVDTVLDADLGAMERAADRFVKSLKPGAVAVFDYSGHGLQVEDQNYLIPVDFKLSDPASVKYDALSASKLHDRMAAAGSDVNIVILDACRNNGFGLSRSSSAGLAAMNAAKGSYIAFSTAPGRTASDDPNGRNGLFTGYLLEGLTKPGLSLDDLFNYVRQHTYDASGGEQLPWTSSSVIGRFYFVPSGDQRDLTYEPNQRSEPAPVAAASRQTESARLPAALDAAVDERMTMLSARAAAVSESLEQLRRAQQQQGLGLRGDMAAAQKQMQYALGQAEKSLADGDGATAERNMGIAEKAIDKLEAFLGR